MVRLPVHSCSGWTQNINLFTVFCHHNQLFHKEMRQSVPHAKKKNKKNPPTIPASFRHSGLRKVGFELFQWEQAISALLYLQSVQTEFSDWGGSFGWRCSCPGNNRERNQNLLSSRWNVVPLGGQRARALSRAECSPAQQDLLPL